jgi:hypothetical protein
MWRCKTWYRLRRLRAPVGIHRYWLGSGQPDKEGSMGQAFVIIQIGNEELERLCAEAVFPAIKAAGLEPRRVDRHNEGGLLKSEIVRFIQESDILIADLTNERPNVYLEIGYAMGIDKFRNLILTVREDHFADSPNHQPGGSKVHFDLAGYDILSWMPGQMDEFRTELERRIRRRLAIVTPRPSRGSPIWDNDWITRERGVAIAGLAEIDRSAFMEIRAAAHHQKQNHTPVELRNAARGAQIETFGWPIAIYLDQGDVRPRPRADGIAARVRVDEKQSFDYWSIRRNGDFYFLGSLFEDEGWAGHIFFDTRIVRITEAVLYCIRLYSGLGLDRSTGISIAVRHGGLRGRTLTTAGNRFVRPRTTDEEMVEADLSGSLDELEADLVDKVVELAAPLFHVFDFFEVSRPVYEDIVNKFVDGQIT